MKIPILISNRHIHLSKKHSDYLFQKEVIKKERKLTQPGEYVSDKIVSIISPINGKEIHKVRVLYPCRDTTQVELLLGDVYTLGLKGKINIQISGTQTKENSNTLLILKYKNKELLINKGVIIPQRHLHISLEDSEKYGLKNGDNIAIRINGIRGGVLENIVVRVKKLSSMEVHIDREEGNGLGLYSCSFCEIIGKTKK